MHGLQVHFTQCNTEATSNAPSSAVPWLRWFLIPLTMVPLLFWLEKSFDLAISAFFFDVSSASFPWREQWFITGFIHRFGRLPATLIFLGFAIAWMLQIRNRNVIRFAQMGFVCTTMLVCFAVVTLIKRGSNSACSWDLVEFGGRYPHLSWFGALPPAISPGHCWPAAFSMSGFVLFALYFYLYDCARARFATLALVFIVIYANALGFVQVMRGAHGLSHQLWTGFFCWYLSLACYWIYSRTALKAWAASQ